MLEIVSSNASTASSASLMVVLDRHQRPRCLIIIVKIAVEIEIS